ncbi:MAG: hypothetical protein EBX41_07740, partial [Chitinophagia bacterium]|nr:hypothetical protein [Chitinophagia bacterium]
MAVFRFRIYWEEDDLTYRDIEVLSKQTFQDFQQVIVKSFDFDGKHPSLFYVSNDRWERSIMLDSEVLTNKKDAPALSMIKTPVAALVADPAQKFIFVYDKDKKWTFLVELLHISKEETFKRTYPYLL